MAEFSEARTLALIAYLRGWWPPLEPDPEVIRAWQVSMKGISWDEAIAAVEWIGTNTEREFAPTPGIVRARVLNSRTPVEPQPELPPSGHVPTAEEVRAMPEYQEARAFLEKVKASRQQRGGIRGLAESLDEALP